MTLSFYCNLCNVLIFPFSHICRYLDTSLSFLSLMSFENIFCLGAYHDKYLQHFSLNLLIKINDITYFKLILILLFNKLSNIGFRNFES